MLQLKKINNIDTELKSELESLGYNETIVNILVNRGYDTETITALLDTGYSEELPLYNDLINVEIGADIIQSHIANNSEIYIYGDYDSDGINSTYILGDAISHAIYFSESDSYLELKVPDRTEGYGLNMNWCEQLVKNSKDKDILVITVDNGISQDKEVEYLLNNNIDVLITDHHMPSGHVPKDVFIIDAHYNDDNENNKGLCGAGVAFKLAMTLLERYESIDWNSLYYKYLIHVAVATITDSMPMTIDNIKYVYNGLQLLKDGYGSDALNYYREYNKNTDLTPKDLAFGLGPQINSCGRMNNTSLALNYLFSDNTEVEDLYNEIVNTNDARKSKTRLGIDTAEEMLDIDDTAIILQLEGTEGIAGIIASNIANKYNKCTIIFNKVDDVLIGSARSDGHLDILDIMKSLNRFDIILKLGGHSNACGVTIKADAFDEFKDLLCKTIKSIPRAKERKTKEVPTIIVDDFIQIKDISKELCEDLKQLYFFNDSNPVFAINNVTINKVKYSGNNPDNVQFTITDSSYKNFDFWTWGMGNEYKSLGEPKQVTLIGEVEYKFGKPSFNVLNIIPTKSINY